MTKPTLNSAHAVDQISAHVGSHPGPGRVPDFFVIGAMKAGTTSLFGYLCRHPQIYMCPHKEPMYFSHEDVHAKGDDWYRSLFAQALPDQICGEASTSYTRWPHFPDVPPRISSMNPQSKFVYVMRHPADRTYSHYVHNLQRKHIHGEKISLTFEQALQESDVYVDTSCYLMQIERYLKYFPRERFFFIVFEQFKKDPKNITNQLQEFLGIEHADLTTNGKIVANISDGRRYASNRIQQQFDSLRRVPGLSQMIGAIPKTWRHAARSRLERSLGRSIFGRHIVKDFKEKVSPPLPQTRVKLLKRFEKPNRQLEEFLGRRLPHWFK